MVKLQNPTDNTAYMQLKQRIALTIIHNAVLRSKKLGINRLNKLLKILNS